MATQQGDLYDLDPEPIWLHWCDVMGKRPGTRLTPRRAAAVRARLIDGFTRDELLRAVDGCAASPFHMGRNQRGVPYNDLELICRSADNVERFIDLWHRSRGAR